jgi:hypothetical protein
MEEELKMFKEQLQSRLDYINRFPMYERVGQIEVMNNLKMISFIEEGSEEIPFN